LQDQGKFHYQNLNTALLGLVLESTYDKPLDILLFEKIWQPAGATGFKWRKYSNLDAVSAYCCLYATIKDWALVANFLMQNGGDEQFLPTELYNYFLGRDFSDHLLRDGEYRGQIRYDILDRKGEAIQGPFLYFMGQGGQTTYLVPQQELIVVRFGGKHQLLHSTLYEAAKLY